MIPPIPQTSQTSQIPSRVLIAPDKFKGSLTAVQAAEAMAAGVAEVLPEAEVRTHPVADGGEGTLEVLAAAGAERVRVPVRGPLDTPVRAEYAVLAGAAYVESARACGIEFVRPSPRVALAAHTAGVGELLAHALEHGATELVLTVGGTASTDGGAGMLRALGARLRGRDGEPPGYGGAALAGLDSVDLLAVQRKLAGVPVRVATDVTNPLLGPRGAAPVFGPQKGAGPAEVALLEAALANWARVLRAAGAPAMAELPGAGAGGGIAGGAVAGLGARLEPGFDLLATLTGLAEAVAGAELVLTGEGSLDEQSLAGKAPARVAELATRHRVPVLALAGRILLTPAGLRGAGFAAARALAEHAPSAEYSRRHAATLLRAQTAELLREWLTRKENGR